MGGDGPDRDDAFHKNLLDNLFDGVYYVDRTRRITYWNRAAERVSGYAAADVVGKRCPENVLRHVDDAGCELCRSRCPLVAAMTTGLPVEREVFLHHRDGHRVPVHVRTSPITDDGGTVVGAVEIFNEDVALRRARDEIDDLRKASHVDVLTGLRNRRALQLSLGSRLRDVLASGRPLGVLFVDLDDFKTINDRHGHQLGDVALRVVGATLAYSVRPSDVLGRWGGDEFLVLAQVEDRRALEALGERVRALVSSSSVAVASGVELRMTVSVGGTLADAKDTPSSLVARADAAMYAAKRSGGDGVAAALARRTKAVSSPVSSAA